jgi:hypothetical protein
LKLPSDKSNVERVVIMAFCIRAPKVERGRRATPLIVAVILENIREGILVLKQEVVH